MKRQPFAIRGRIDFQCHAVSEIAAENLARQRIAQILFDGPPSALDSTKDRRVSQFVKGEAGERLMEMLASRSKGPGDTLSRVDPNHDDGMDEE